MSPTRSRVANSESAFEHFQLAGASEGRSASEFFDTTRYLEANPDVAAAGLNALEHYLVLGVREGRAASHRRC